MDSKWSMMGHLPDISTNYSYSDFRRDLRKALPNLYNAYFLRKCRILRFAGLTSTQDKSLEFRNRVIRTISSLEPKAEGKTKAVDWRIYQVLHSRFVEQFTQDEVSKDLFLSVRQIRRLEVQAIEILADRLWADLFVNKQEPSLLESSTKLLDKKPSNDIWKEINEFSWLENANARQKINFSQMFRSILETIQPLLESRKTQIEFLDSHETIEVSADLITLRQALMTLLTSLSTKLSDCSLSLSICSSNQDQTRVRVCIKVHSRKDELFDILMDDYISIARRLLSISQARLEYKKDDDLSIFIDIPLAEQIPVLVIDDNHDTLLLMERLLTGTHYRFFRISSLDCKHSKYCSHST